MFCKKPGIKEIFLLIATMRPINRPSTSKVSRNEFVTLKKPNLKMGSAANETIAFILKANPIQVKKKN
jgi:hypothetical protein